MKKKILCFVAYYLPGSKSGGPVRSISNMVERLSDKFDFYIVTADRDSFDIKPYDNIIVNGWNKVGKAQVFYMSPEKRTLNYIKSLVKNTEHDLIYLNSFFSKDFSIKPLLLNRLRLLSNKPLVLAPRGEFSVGALALKSFKKNLFVYLAKILGLSKGICWHASTEHEKNDIISVFNDSAHVSIAPNLLPVFEKDKVEKPQSLLSSSEQLRVVFISRVSPKKNVYFALEVLSKLDIPVRFDIYGSISDSAYWGKCQALISELPENISVNYCAAIPHSEVSSTLSQYDLFFLPTMGENFGHAIVEAWLAGVPVLISDQTPWLNLNEKQLGFDLALNDKKSFVEALTWIYHRDELEKELQYTKIKEFATELITGEESTMKNTQLFIEALNAS